MESTVWKYTMESIVRSIWNEYGNYSMSLLIPEKTGLHDSTTSRHSCVLALLRFDIVKNSMCIITFLLVLWKFFFFLSLIICTNKNLDIIANTETRITKNVSITNNLNTKNYSIEFTLIESSAGGTLLHIANHLSYKSRQDLNIYKKNELESTFIEIMNPKNSNIIVGTIYKHLSMDLTDFKFKHYCWYHI